MLYQLSYAPLRFPEMARQDSNLRPLISNDVVPAAFAVKIG